MFTMCWYTGALVRRCACQGDLIWPIVSLIMESILTRVKAHKAPALVLVLAATSLINSGCATAQEAASLIPFVPKPYLGQKAWPDASQILPKPPETGSQREAQDQALFKASRALEGSARWKLAQNDVPTAPSAMLANFRCATGLDLTPQSAPKLTALISRVGMDSGFQVSTVKDVYKRKRPYLITDGAICVARSLGLDSSPDYPSGHSTWGWSIGLILAELLPDRATSILARARAYGESRAVCGVHSASAVEAGRTNGAVLIAALHASAEFRSDMDAAKAELKSLQERSKPNLDSCDSEAALIAQPLYSGF
jgi:acid phosphatase (class A)